jgi:hypothetical protein
MWIHRQSRKKTVTARVCLLLLYHTPWLLNDNTFLVMCLLPMYHKSKMVLWQRQSVFYARNITCLYHPDLRPASTTNQWLSNTHFHGQDGYRKQVRIWLVLTVDSVWSGTSQTPIGVLLSKSLLDVFMACRTPQIIALKSTAMIDRKRDVTDFFSNKYG